MSGIRSSFVICREKEFNAGKDEGDAWIAPPPGSFLSTTHNRSTTRVYTSGSKTWDTVAYGQLSGSFEFSFVMDYNYLEPLFFVFDDVSHSTGEYTFTKSNAKRVPSFTIRRKILNRITANGGDDETIEYKGCVVKTCRFSKSAGASQVNVSLTGFYATESMSNTPLDATDYKDYSGNLVEFSCMFVGDINAGNYVANTESLSLGIENSAAAIYTTCSPFASSFSEGQTSYTFGTTCYSNNPEHYKRRVYSGGFNGSTLTPMSKGMAPIPIVNLASYNGTSEGDGTTVADVFENSSMRANFKLSKVVIKSLTWQKGDGSKLQDQINSTEFQKMTLTVKNGSNLDETNIWTNANPNALNTQ